MASRSAPAGVVAVHCAGELGLGGVPLAGGLEGDVGRGVVHHREGGHPEVVAQPGHEPVLGHARQPCEISDRGNSNECESCNGRQRHQHLHIATAHVRDLKIAAQKIKTWSTQDADVSHG